jgi:hypothetical protein
MKKSDRTEQIKRYIKKDITDDFWRDIIYYEDMLESEHLGELEEVHIPSPIQTIDIPKPSGVLRPGHHISIQDRFYYFDLLLDFCYKIESVLSRGSTSYSYTLAYPSERDKDFIRHNIYRWKAFEKRQQDEFNKNPDWVMLKTDISAFFEHIVIKKLIERISIHVENQKNNKIAERSVKKLNDLLNFWASSNNLTIGIPQGNDTSSFLANVYLDEVDKGMIESGFVYFRFTDDIRIFVKNKREAEKALIKLTHYLRPLNLHLNSSKTFLVSRNQFEIDQDEFNDEMTGIEYDIDTSLHSYLPSGEVKVNQEVAREVEIKLKKIFNKSIKNDEFNPRNFKFCVNRFRKLKSKYPLSKILKLKSWEYSTIKEICDYISKMDFANNTKVKNKIISIYNTINYDYLKILLLKTLIFSKKDVACLDLNAEDDFNSDNFMLKGYISIFIFKFFNETKQNEIVKNIQNNHIHHKDFIRYVAIGSNFIINPTVKKNLQKVVKSSYPQFAKLWDKIENLKDGSNLKKLRTST